MDSIQKHINLDNGTKTVFSSLLAPSMHDGTEPRNVEYLMVDVKEKVFRRVFRNVQRIF